MLILFSVEALMVNIMYELKSVKIVKTKDCMKSYYNLFQYPR